MCLLSIVYLAALVIVILTAIIGFNDGCYFFIVVCSFPITYAFITLFFEAWKVRYPFLTRICKCRKCCKCCKCCECCEYCECDDESEDNHTTLNQEINPDEDEQPKQSTEDNDLMHPLLARFGIIIPSSILDPAEISDVSGYIKYINDPECNQYLKPGVTLDKVVGYIQLFFNLALIAYTIYLLIQNFEFIIIALLIILILPLPFNQIFAITSSFHNIKNPIINIIIIVKSRSTAHIPNKTFSLFSNFLRL